MAIILPGPADDDSEDVLGDAIAGFVRPALLVRDGNVVLDATNFRFQSLRDRLRLIEYALQSVGRIETDASPYPFVGTAFVIGPDRAVTARFVAELLLQKRPGGESGLTNHPLEGVWLNFKAEDGRPGLDRIAVLDVQLVHPYWGFAFLTLAETELPKPPLAIASRMAEDDLRGREVCVIGYPSLDARDDPDSMRRIFSNTFDVKRVMPGRITGLERRGAESSLNLMHDATTMGGTSGGPLIDTATGEVLGLHLGGVSRLGNFAAPAWEIVRDPMWWAKSDLHALAPRTPAEVAREVIGAQDDDQILLFDEVEDLLQLLIKVGIKDLPSIGTLLVGLPNEYLAALPQQGESASDRLRSVLHGINDAGGRIRGHSAFYFVLKNAKGKRIWDEDWTRKMDALLAVVQQREAAGG